MTKTLKGITWDHPRGYQPLVACSVLYEKENHVRVEWHRRSLTDFGDQSLEELCNVFDLLIIDHPHVGLAEQTKCIEPLNSIVSEKKLSLFAEQSAGPSYYSYAYNGYQWAIPIDAAVQTAACRPDLLSSLRIPRSWTGVFELASDLAKENRYIGMALSPTDCLCTFLTLAAQAQSPISEESLHFIDKATGLHVLQQLKEMKELFHPSCLEWTPIHLFDYMTNNDDLVYSPLAFCYNNYSRNDFSKKSLSFYSPPGIDNAILGGAGIAISSMSNHKDLAGDYISWICDAEIQKTVYVQEQGQPGNVVAWTDEKANQVTNNFFENTIRSIQGSYVRPKYYGWTIFQTQLGNIVHDYLKFGREEHEVIQELDHLYLNSKRGL